MATDLEMKLLMDKLESQSREVAELTRRLNEKDKAGNGRLTWATAAPQGPLTEIAGRCTLCNRTHKIMTDDPTKGKKGFRFECPCQVKQKDLGGDTTTWHMRTDYDPEKDGEQGVETTRKPEDGAVAARVPKGGSKLEPQGGVSA